MLSREESEYDKHLRKIKAGEHPKENTGGPHDDAVYTHPAFGGITANRVSGDRLLFGSDFEHHNYVTISIHRAKMHRSLSRDWANHGDEIIEVCLSEAQWATFVSNMNAGGTECTIAHLDGKLVPYIASKPDRKTQFAGEITDRLKKVEAAVAALREEAEGKARKTVMRDLLTTIENDLTPNLTFVANQFGKHMETTTEKAKIEVAAYVERVIDRAGLKALGAKPPINMLTDQREPKQKAE